ncbi:MAG: N-acetyltransferase [Lysobacterales bacterium]|nr:MAG: N-acetyltransferase [Xanthomonadales bacterium]
MTEVLETERLTLRHATTADDQFIFELVNDPAFIRNIGDRGVRTLADAERYVLDGPIASYEKYGFGMYVVQLSESGTPIGLCGFVKRDWLPDVDIGFAFLPQCRSQGYARESASAVRRYGHEVLGLTRIVAIVSPENADSIRLLQKIGLRFEGMVRPVNEDADIKLFAAEA